MSFDKYTTCGKIQTRKIKNGLSHSLLLVHNKRNYMKETSEFDVVHWFGTVRSYNIARDAPAMWENINTNLDLLVAEGRINRDDARRAQSKFKTILGEAPATPAPVPANPKSNPTAKEKVRAIIDSLAGR